MAKPKFKEVVLEVTVKVPVWVTKTQARREVKTLINEGVNWLDGRYLKDGEYSEMTVKATKVASANFKCLCLY